MIDHVETPSPKHPQLVNTTHHVANNPMLMNHEYHYTKSWFDVEMDETVTLLLRKLEEAGVHTEYVVIDEKYPTGICTMNMAKDGRYFSINSLGANWQLKAEDLERALDQHAFDMITPAPAKIIGFLACLIKSNAFLTCLRLPLIVGL